MNNPKKYYQIPKQNLQTDFKEDSTFYFVGKEFEIDEPMYLIFIKAESFDLIGNYEFLHAEFIKSTEHQLKELEKPYYDECTHLLISEKIPFDDELAVNGLVDLQRI